MTSSSPPPIALTIAGSDCCSGAGIQADLKTFTHHRVHGLTALTCVVAENPREVLSIHEVPVLTLQHQLKALLDTYPVAAVKTGMLYSRPHIIAIAEILKETQRPLVIDPVMVATSGSSLIDQAAIETYKDDLFPLAALITPNLPEASTILGRAIQTIDEMEAACSEIATTYSTSCLLKGGHLSDSHDKNPDQITDILYHQGKFTHFQHAHIDIACTHGTGCTLSAAITAHLAAGETLPTSCQRSIDWLQNVIRSSHRWLAKDKDSLYCLNHWA